MVEEVPGRGAGHGRAPVLSASRRNRLEKKDRARHASSPDARAVSAAAEVAEGAGQKQTSGHDQGLGWARPAGQQPGSRYLVLVCSETTAAYNLEAVGVASRQTWRTCEGTGWAGWLAQGQTWTAPHQEGRDVVRFAVEGATHVRACSVRVLYFTRATLLCCLWPF